MSITIEPMKLADGQTDSNMIHIKFDSGVGIILDKHETVVDMYNPLEQQMFYLKVDLRKVAQEKGEVVNTWEDVITNPIVLDAIKDNAFMEIDRVDKP
jgi:hypothetical protein